MNANPYQHYLETAVQTASPARLVLMLYDAALKNCAQAKAMMADRNIEAVNRHMTKAQNILSELMSSLNMDAGSISQNLFSLYEYMNYRLVQANIRRDPAMIDEVVMLLTQLRSAWAEIVSATETPALHAAPAPGATRVTSALSVTG